MSTDLAVAWRRHVGAGHAAEAERDEVCGAYLGSMRIYHGLRHLVWVVRHVASLAADPAVAVVDLDAVVAAAFYHDVIYDPTKPDNEDRSASAAVRQLDNLGWADDRARRVGDLVRITAGHVPSAGDVDAAILCDGDLAVLATAPEGYGAYARGVRREYAHVDEAGWTEGRRRVLESFLDRPAIYSTETGRRRWEARARANITAEIAGLT